MTREEILAMEPGYYLDALVAEKIMGWTKFGVREDGSHNGWNAPYGYSSTTMGYSQIISAAWEVLEKPEIMDRYQIGVYPTSFGKWIARPFMPGGRDCTVQADTAPEAICKCALLAILPREEET